MTISRRYTTIIGTRDFLKLYTPDALEAWPLSVVVLVWWNFQSRIRGYLFIYGLNIATIKIQRRPREVIFFGFTLPPSTVENCIHT